MKTKVLKPILFLFLVLGFASACNDDDSSSTQVDTTNYARFTNLDELIEVGEETGDIVEIPVQINYRSSSPVFVSYTLTGDAANYELVGSTTSTGIEIPAGSRQAYIQLKPVDNDEANDPMNSVVIELTDADNGAMIPENSSAAGATMKTVLFKDDECAEVLSSSYTSTSYAFGLTGPTFVSTFTPYEDADGNVVENKWTLDTTWGPDFVAWATGNGGYSGQYIYPSVLTLHDDNTVTVEGAGYATGGTGTYSPEPAGKFEITLTQGLFTNPFTVDVVMIGNCD